MIEDDIELLKKIVDPLAKEGPVYPLFVNELGVVVKGMTKRELFAAIAMHAIVISPVDEETVMNTAVRLADALLAELGKKPEI